MKKQQLPINKVIPEIKTALCRGSAVLAAPPGTGKTTVVPLALLEEEWLGNRKILILEPRRLAARAAAARMSWLLGEKCGQTVGYHIRFDRCVSRQTRIEVLTEGILTRRIQNDPDMADVGLIIFDEFHERSIHADLALALCLDVCQITDLRLLIMSATLAVEPISRLLGGAPVINCELENYPVDIEYIQHEAVGKIQPTLKGIRKVLNERQGDILAFLPGVGEINAVNQQLLEGLSGDILSLPLYGNLTQFEQDRVIMPDSAGRRRVVLATSIAETSLTIEGVTNVVDSGWSRRSRFNPTNGMSGLETVRVSKAVATQRAGRAGRLGPGYCLRLWTENQHHSFVPFLPPELLTADLANLALELFLWGAADPADLLWLDCPRSGTYQQAKELLISLGVIKNNQLTTLGRKVASLPLHPRLGVMLLMADESGQTGLACDLAALISERDIVYKSGQTSVDLLDRLHVLELWRTKGGSVNKNGVDSTGCLRINRLTEQWLRLISAKRQRSDYHNIAGLLAYAYPDRIAKQRSESKGRYVLANGKGVYLPQDDHLVVNEYLVVPQLDAGHKEGKIYLAAAVNIDELRKTHQELFSKTQQVAWDDDKKRVTALEIERLGEIVTQEKSWDGVDQDLIVQALLTGIRSLCLDCLPWDKVSRQLQSRINCLRSWQPEENWPDLSDEELLKNLSWIEPYLAGMYKLSHLKSIQMATILKAMLTWDQQQTLQRDAPVRLQVASGSLIELHYQVGELPRLAVRIQELYGTADNPSVCMGRVPVVIHLLSPARRPIQITSDLAGFWAGSYPEVIKEMKGRYPKHFWPDDPAKAVATKSVKGR
nr:ATP-dependent helicase HrpB [Desulfobulbaceae bacterium]